MPNTFTTSMDTSKPAGTRSLLLGDDDIREFKVQFCERFNIDHVQPQSEAGVETVGFHRKVTYVEQGSDPLAVADAIIAYAKLSGSYSELFVQHENAGVVQLTRLGKLWIESLGINAETRGDVIVRGTSAWGRLALGASGTFLRSNGTDLLAAAIQSGDIAISALPAAVSGSAVGTSDISTVATSFEDMTDMSVTVTTNGRPVLILFTGALRGSNTNNSRYLTLSVDGTEQSVQGMGGDNHNEHTSGKYNTPYFELVAGLAAGEHTFKMRWKVDAGTGYQDGATANRKMIVIEL